MDFERVVVVVVQGWINPQATNKTHAQGIKGQGGTTKIRLQGNVFDQPEIRLKNTPRIKKMYEK